MVKRISCAFDLGNGQFYGEMPVWRARLGKRLDSRKETETRLKLRRVGYLEVMGDVVPHWKEYA